MTLSEFKAWFEGFSEIMEGPPDEKQWERIKARVAEINGASTPYPIFVDRYIEPYRRYWPNVPYWTSGSALLGCNTPSSAASSTFESHSAMFDLGRAEYKSALSAA
ncbi:MULTISPECIES: hypothetical protein [unclassified Sinorhizobium]|uniref:hypothetical protein n=1 Tax=unclassified Sinorhizobium TaxID=2613772 RepID=UPI003523B5B2